MDVSIRMMLFFAVAITVVFLLYWLIIGRLFSYFGLKRAWFVALIIIALTFAAMFVQGRFNTQFTYYIYMVFMILLGIVWISISVIVLAELTRLIAPSISKETIGLVALGIIAVLTGVSLILANTWQVREYTLISSKVKEQVRIVQLSDLHIQGPSGNIQYNKVLSKALAQKPDAILITGDLIDPGLPNNLYYNTKVPIIATMGNHEFYVGDKYSEEYFAKSNITLLRESAIEQKGLLIVGADDQEGITKVNKLIAESKSENKKENYTILMYHSPANVERISGADLVLCGHTHAGQLFPFNFLIPLQFKYINGWYDLDNTKLYVTSGAGTWGPPMRLGSTNEIVVINIKPAAQK